MRVDGPRTHLVCEYTDDSISAGATYQSPAGGTCEANVAVLISDGSPSQGHNPEATETILGYPMSGCEDIGQTLFGHEETLSRERRVDGRCAFELAAHVLDTDMFAGVPGSSVQTHAIGSNLADVRRDYLIRVADSGGGTYADAGNLNELTVALEGVMESAISGTGNASNLYVTVDRARGAVDTGAYMSLFVPSREKSWYGNFKGFYLNGGALQDVHGNEATVTRPEGLVFRDKAQSFWSSGIDGAGVLSGGATGQLNPATRNLYTFLGDASAVTGNGADLSASPDYELNASNSELTDAMFGGVPKAAVLDWINDQPLGAPLHSNVVIWEM